MSYADPTSLLLKYSSGAIDSHLRGSKPRIIESFMETDSNIVSHSSVLQNIFSTAFVTLGIVKSLDNSI